MSLKKIVKFSVAFTLIYFFPSALFPDDIKDAEKFYKTYDYKYALEIYLKIMQATPKMEIAERIANCYRFMNDTEQAEIWYQKTLAYPGASPNNFKYLADAQKQNGKFEDAALSFKNWGEKTPEFQKESEFLANGCNVAKNWNDNPDIGAQVTANASLNSKNSDFSPFAMGDDIVITSDRWNRPTDKSKGTQKEIFGWTGNPYLKLYKVGKNGIEPLDKKINLGYHNGPAIVSKSGDTLFFTRVIASAKTAPKNDPGKKYLLYAVKKEGEWELKDKLPFNESGQFSVQHPALSVDGQVLYFVSDMPGGYGGMDIYYSQRQADATWSTPKNCGSEINTKEDDVFPYVREDGKFFFSSKGHIGIGGLDIFSADGSKDQFKNVENLRSPINSPKDDFGIMFSKEDTNKGLLSSNRNGGMGGDDIYDFKLGIKADPKSKETMFAVNGLVVEKGSDNVMPGTKILLINQDLGTQESVTADANGKFTFNLSPETDYMLKGDLDKFYTARQNGVSTKGLKVSTIFEVKFELEKAGPNIYTIQFDNVYHDFDKWAVRLVDTVNLNKVSKFMASLPNVRIDLISHTDSRGTMQYNQVLSEKRAHTVKAYMVKEGIDGSRLGTVGKGETQLLNQCKDGAKCSEYDHRINRRTEFKVVRIAPITAMAKKTIIP